MRYTLPIKVGAILTVLGATLLYTSLSHRTNLGSSDTIGMSILTPTSSDSLSLLKGLTSFDITSVDEDGYFEFTDDKVDLNLTTNKSGLSKLSAEIDTTYEWDIEVTCSNCTNGYTVQDLTFYSPILNDYQMVDSLGYQYLYADTTFDLETLSIDDLANGPTVNNLSHRFDWTPYVKKMDASTDLYQHQVNIQTPATLAVYLGGDQYIDIKSEGKDELEVVIKNSKNQTVYSSSCAVQQIQDLAYATSIELPDLGNSFKINDFKTDQLKNFFEVSDDCYPKQTVPNFYPLSSPTFPELEGFEFDGKIDVRDFKEGLYFIAISSDQKDEEEQVIYTVSLNSPQLAIIPPVKFTRPTIFYIDDDDGEYNIDPQYKILSDGATHSVSNLSDNITKIDTIVPLTCSGPTAYTSSNLDLTPFLLTINTYDPDLIIADHIQDTIENGNTLVSLPLLDNEKGDLLHISLIKKGSPQQPLISRDVYLDKDDLIIDNTQGLGLCQDMMSKNTAVLYEDIDDMYSYLKNEKMISNNRDYNLQLSGPHEFLIQTVGSLNIDLEIGSNERSSYKSFIVEDGELFLCSDGTGTGNVNITCGAKTSALTNYLIQIETEGTIHTVQSAFDMDLYILNSIKTIRTSTFFTNYSTAVLASYSSDLGNKPQLDESSNYVTGPFFIIPKGAQQIMVRGISTIKAPLFSTKELDAPFIMTPVKDRLFGADYCIQQKDVARNKFYWFRYE